MDNTFSPAFVESFVERCMELGLDANETESLYRKQANNAILSRPDVHAGLTAGLKKAANVRRSSLLRVMGPDAISQVMDCRILYGDDPLSHQIRKEAGFPEPDWSTVPENLQEAGIKLASTMQGYNALPLNQQILLAMILGGGVGAGARAVNPSGEDQMAGRGVMSRAFRGAGHGAAVGAGAAAGASAGGFAGDALAGPGNVMKLPMQFGGAMAGGAAANHLANAL